MGVEGDADSSRARPALARCRPLFGVVNNLEVLLVDSCHEHLIGLEWLLEVAIVSCEICQRVLQSVTVEVRTYEINRVGQSISATVSINVSMVDSLPCDHCSCER